MLRQFSLFLLTLLLTAIPGFSQIFPGIGIPGIGSPGGGYPGGGYPGGGYPNGSGSPYPGGRRQNPNNQGPLQTFVGSLRNISNTDLLIQTDDRLTITILLPNGTRYYVSNGNMGRNSDFQTGDRVSIDATQDYNSGLYRALRVTQLRPAPDDDQRSAQSNTSGNSSTDDSDRPRLSRNPDSGSSTQSASPSNTSTAAPPTRDSDDPGPPQLKRATPAQTSSSASSSAPDSQPVVVADARPSIRAADINGVTRLPAAAPTGMVIPRTDDPVIDQARDAAFSFSETLPNYVVKQFTTRYATEAATGGHTSWRALDNVTADVICEGGTEKYKNILVDGRPPKKDIEKTGSWSSGEFASLLQDVLSPRTNADFHGKRSTTIVNRDSFRYDFTVAQPNSHWQIYADTLTYVPGYSGVIWIDKQTFRVLRIELAAKNVPTSFPLDTVESAVDYDFVAIGDNKYLLPVHSEALSCVRGTSDCNRNVIDFRNYKKFSSETNITFEPDAK